MSAPIPQPPALPLLGNINSISADSPFLSLQHLSQKYGPIFQLSILGKTTYFVTTVELMNELCDEKRFQKNIPGRLEQTRHGVGDGLFTAYTGEENWAIAHRTLLPAFGPLPIISMFDEMHDIAAQLIGKWARVGPDEKIEVTEDFTRLAFDTIALCAMDKRLNSFYHDELHPFVVAMTRFLLESGRRTQRTKLGAMWNRSSQKQFDADIAFMRSIAQEVIDRRRANPNDKKDLLNSLLFGKDPKTGKTMANETIMNNMLTFLIAGHETTSGTLSFTTYYMLKNPEVYHKAQQEIDAVVGKGPVRLEHLNKLPFLDACIKEAMRLSPPAPGLAFEPIQKTDSTVLGGKYLLPPKASVVGILASIGRDTQAFGPDAAEYKPERMLAENFDKLPPNSWKPFGNGARGCIGRPFAWQEMMLILALILQNFDLRFADPAYELQIQQNLTIKPAHFEIHASLREGIDAVRLEKKMFSAPQDNAERSQKTGVATNDSELPMTILYGSNSGTCESLAQSLAVSATAKGYKARVASLDSAVGKLPTDQPVVIVCSSYEGLPPDNARLFVNWLKNIEPAKMKGVRFSVFGCGHHDWVATFHKVPKLIEQELASKGATLIGSSGFTDVAKNQIVDDFDSWQDTQFWPGLTKRTTSDEEIQGLDMEISVGVRASHLRHEVQQALVIDNRLLSAPGAPEKWHMEIKLPTSLTYSAGDYLALLPMNNMKTISRVLKRFNLPFDVVVKLAKGSHTTIPTEHNIALMSILGAYVELTAPATKKNVATLEKHAPDQAAKDKLAAAASAPVISVLDLLERVPEIDLPISIYLAMLPSMRIRQYSISSSPLKDPTIASITYSVVDDQHGHLGVATNYLKSLQAGSSVQVSIKKSPTAFHLPSEDSTPIIMLGAGTGVAPFRGFIQERATKLATKKVDISKLGPAALFIGCRDPEKDVLYREEMAEYEKTGAVKIYYAFSRAPEFSDGCKHVQDRLYKEKKLVSELFANGARAYICGSAAVGTGTADVAAKIGVENAKEKGVEITHAQALNTWNAMRNERYAVDVFD